MIPFTFLALTFAISLAGFACVALIPSAQSPEGVTGLPFWLIMVWGPSLAAMILSQRDGALTEILGRAITVSTVPLSAWILVLAPLALLLLLRPSSMVDTPPIGAGLVVTMVAINLILGPLGEELGWRGYFQEHLQGHIGWLAASLVIGVIWLVWHLPLWTIESPHAQIALPLFAAHVMCYSILIGAGYALSNGSILPAILIHLTVNLASNLALFSGFPEPNDWFRASLWYYAVLSLIAAVLVTAQAGQLD